MEMQKARRRIDRIDNGLINLLSERMALIPKLAEYKQKNKLPIENKKRELEVVKRLSKKAGKDLSPIFIKVLFMVIMREAKRIQVNHLKKRKA